MSENNRSSTLDTCLSENSSVVYVYIGIILSMKEFNSDVFGTFARTL